MIKQQQPELDPEQIANTYKMVVMVAGPDGQPQQAGIPIIQVLEQSAPLQTLESHCSQCAANVRKQPFGCFGAINYPISQTEEEWLLQRLPADAKDPALATLFKFLVDNKVNGSPVDSQRSRREVYESSSPLKRKWPGFFSRKSATSSQILHLMVFMDNLLKPQQTAAIAGMLGYSKSSPTANDTDSVTNDWIWFMTAALNAVELKADFMIDA